MSKRDDLLLLEDIVSSGDKVLTFIKGFNLNSFLKDVMVQDACIRNFEIIGEAASRVSQSLKDSNPDIPWRKLSNYRNLLIHEYFGVNLEIVWDIIENELAGTLQYIKALIRN